MPKRFRLTRRMTLGLTEDAHRTLRRLMEDTGLEDSELVSFVLENWDGVTDKDRLAHRLRQFRQELDARKG